MKTAEEWVEYFISLVEDNLENPNLTSEDWAEMLNLSRRQFYRQVENLTGQSPNTFVRDIRIKKAGELLESGEFRTVKEIAYRVGFKKPSYFSKVYEESKGVSPAEILKNGY